MRPPKLTAVTRFGLGPRPGEIAEAARDPKEFVRAQCDDPNLALLSADLLGVPALEDEFNRLHSVYAEARDANRDNPTPANDEAMREAGRARTIRVNEILQAEINARYAHGVATTAPFLERLVLFWSNHFAVTIRDGVRKRMVAGAFEREAIRPNVLGFFGDMLVEATTHPAMLMSLDNVRSIGPNSRAGQRNPNASVNENLARELLELHTVGVDAGYDQTDVVETALVLTGWTGGFRYRPGESFRENFHEPGQRTVMGRTYAEGGEEQLYDLLADLAVHPATANRVCGKLARHMVGDEVPAALIETLADTFLTTGGDLYAVTMALIESDAAWAGGANKTVPPYDFMVAAGRLLEVTDIRPRFLRRAAIDLAQHVWRPPSPEGWPDDDDAFLGGDALLERIDFAQVLAGRHAKRRDVLALAREAFGDALDPWVEEAIMRAESPHQATVLLLMSPALQRR